MIAATPLALGEDGDPVTRVGELDFLDGLELISPDRRFGELSGRELGRLEAPLTVDNFAGLAVRRDALGRTLIYLVSDDNFKPYQRTVVMQFRLAE